MQGIAPLHFVIADSLRFSFFVLDTSDPVTRSSVAVKHFALRQLLCSTVSRGVDDCLLESHAYYFLKHA
jgi:hypothetical protein